MNCNKLVTACLVAITVLSLTTVCLGLVVETDEGLWPDLWPKELEPLRKQSRTISVGTLIQEEIYEIKFDDRETFERLWPVILGLRSSGGTLTLFCVEGNKTAKQSALVSNKSPVVRIRVPSRGLTAGASAANAEEMRDALQKRQTNIIDKYLAEGKLLKAVPPWPSSVLNENGDLPQ
jgi:hypothetical protein